MVSAIVVYATSFAILFVLTVVISIMALSKYHTAYYCSINPNIWCWDDWQCENNSTDNNQSNCFSTAADGNPGLLSCLAGANSTTAKLCEDGNENCVCPDPIEGADNCLQGCPGNFSEVTDACKTKL